MNTKVLHTSLVALLITSTTFFSVHAMKQPRTLPPVITTMQLTEKEDALLKQRVGNDLLAELEFSVSAIVTVALAKDAGHVLTIPARQFLLTSYSTSTILMLLRTYQVEHNPPFKKAFAAHLQLSALLKKAQHTSDCVELDTLLEEARQLYPKEFVNSQPTAPTCSEKCFYFTQNNLCMHLPILNTIGRSVFLLSSLPSLQRQVDLFNTTIKSTKAQWEKVGSARDKEKRQ